MNPLETRTLIATHLRAHMGVGYGFISSVELVSPVAGDPSLRLRLKADDPTGVTRTLLVTVEEELAEDAG